GGTPSTRPARSTNASPPRASRIALVPTASTRIAPASRISPAYDSRQARVRSTASGARAREASTLWPRRVIVARSTTARTSVPWRSATSRSTEFVPMSIAATRTCVGAALLGERLQVEHLLDVRHHHQLAAAVRLLVLGRVVGLDRVGLAVARCAPLVRVETPA